MSYFGLLNDSSLALHWPLNDTFSPFQPADSSGNRNHSTNTSTLWATADGPTEWLRRGIVRTGSSDNNFFSRDSLVFDPNVQSFSLSMWLRRVGSPADCRIHQLSEATAATGFRFGYRGGQYAIVVLASSYGVVANEEWQHLVFGWDQSEIKAYSNGVAAANGGQLPLGARPLVNGFRLLGADNSSPLGIEFSQMMLFTRELDASEVMTIYRGPQAGGVAAFSGIGRNRRLGT
jgi:hypothetical protein